MRKAVEGVLLAGWALRAARHLLPVLLALLATGLAAPAEDLHRRFHAGRPLIEALEDLRSLGLDVIYSSDLVRGDMRVLAEPIASTLRGILDDLIAPHGLETRDGPGGTLLIVTIDGEGAADATGGITGRVVSGEDRRPAPGARVSVQGTDLSVLTAPDGRFLLPRLAPGRWTLDIRSADGRMQQSIEVPVESGEVTRAAIALAFSPDLIEGIVVTPTRYRMVSEQPEPRQTLQAEELERMAHLGDDAHRAVARLPGTAAGDKSARFSLRGGEWNEVLVVLDGLEIDQPFHLKDFFAFSGIVDSRAIDRIDLLTGGFPVEYGGRMSGVMELVSAIPAEAHTTSLGVGIPNTRAMIQGRTQTEKARWLVGARAWYPDAILDTVDPGGEDINPYYYDLLGKFEYHRESGTTFSGHVLSARDIVDFEGEEIEGNVHARYDTTYWWLNIDSPWTQRLISMTQLSTGRIESNRRGEIADPNGGLTEIDEDRVSEFLGARQGWLFRGSDRYLLKWGFDTRLLDAEYDYASHFEINDPLFTPPPPPVIVDRRILLRPSGSRLGAYAAVRAKLLPSLTGELGLRWERQTYSRDRQIDPRINLVWAAGERSTVRAAWGLFHQPQRIDELQVEDGVEEFFPAQLSEHRLISVEHDFTGQFHLRGDVYWKVLSHPRPRYENLLNPNDLLPEGEPDRVRIAPRRATARGLEIYLRSDATKKMSWWAGYALTSAVDDIDGRSQRRSWDQTHAVNAGWSCRFEPGWQIDLAGVWHSGWPTTAVDARAVTDPNGVVTIQPIVGRRNAESFPPYHRLDLRLSRRVRFPQSTLTLYLDVLNLYDRENVCCVDELEFHPETGGDVRVERHEGIWLERLPSFGITWEF